MARLIINKNTAALSSDNIRSDVDAGIRSYVIRKGRITKAQARALTTLSDDYLIQTQDTPPCWTTIFNRSADLLVEIGSGYGNATAALAAANPQLNHIAFEVHEAGIGALMNRLAADSLTNVRIIQADALAAIPRMFAPASIARINIFFPDPWHKARHHKRRLIRPSTIALLAEKLKPNGIVHFASDCANYAESAQEQFLQSPNFAPHTPIPNRPETPFARRAQRAARPIKDLCYRRTPRALCQIDPSGF